MARTFIFALSAVLLSFFAPDSAQAGKNIDELKNGPKIVQYEMVAGVQSGGIYTVRPSQRLGGSIDRFVARVNWLNRELVFVRMPSGSYLSSGTFYLLADNVCVGKNARFGFHGPQNLLLGTLGVPVRGLSDEKYEYIVKIMVDNYNIGLPGLGDWFKENASHKFGTFSMSFLSGAQLNQKFGVPLCGTGQSNAPQVAQASISDR